MSPSSMKHKAQISAPLGNISASAVPTWLSRQIASSVCERRDGPQVLCVISDNLSHSATSGAEAHGFPLSYAFVLVTSLGSQSAGWSSGGTQLPGPQLCQTPVSAEGCGSAVLMLQHEAQSVCAQMHRLAEAGGGVTVVVLGGGVRVVLCTSM